MARRRALEILAVLLSFSIVLVLFAGLDDLPRDLRAGISSEQQALAQSVKQFQNAKSSVTQDLAADPDLFRAHDMLTTWPDRLKAAGSRLDAASKDMAVLVQLRDRNRRTDRQQAEALLREERQYRQAAIGDASGMLAEANRWIERKNNLPAQLQQMERDYQAARGANLAAIATAVQRAESDWPGKKADLDTRLAALKEIPAGAEKTWQTSEALRRKAAANQTAGLDYAALFTAADTLHADAVAVPAKTAELQALTGQLYYAWDKVLVDLESRRGDYREKVRTVRTRLVDASGKKSDITTDEQWVSVPRATYDAMQKNLGMAIEHKSAGKFDFEADKTVQPTGFAYIASPEQGRNQYGYWDHRGGQSFWVWYGQYALLRDLLFNRDYRPLNTGDYYGYRTSQRSGQTYYGRDAETGAPKYGSNGTWTQSRYRDSTYMRQSGSYRDSRYAARPGGFRGSQYSSPSSRSRRDDSIFSRPPSSGRSFGSPRSAPRSFGGGGGGRRFGGGGRRR